MGHLAMFGYAPLRSEVGLEKPLHLLHQTLHEIYCSMLFAKAVRDKLPKLPSSPPRFQGHMSHMVWCHPGSPPDQPFFLISSISICCCACMHPCTDITKPQLQPRHGAHGARHGARHPIENPMALGPKTVCNKVQLSRNVDKASEAVGNIEGMTFYGILTWLWPIEQIHTNSSCSCLHDFAGLFWLKKQNWSFKSVLSFLFRSLN